MAKQIIHANHSGITFANVGEELRATVTIDPQDGEPGVGVPADGNTLDVLEKASPASYDTRWAAPAALKLEAVAGGSGFMNANGHVVVDLANARHAHLLVNGNIDSLAFTDIPNGDEFSIYVTLVLRFDATGNHTLSGLTSVEWANGGSWSDVNRAPNAENHISLWTVGSALHGAIVRTGIITLDPYVMSFPENMVQGFPITQSETLDLGAVTHRALNGAAGDGTFTFQRGRAGSLTAASGETPLIADDVLVVTLASSTAHSVLSIPRRLT